MYSSNKVSRGMLRPGHIFWHQESVHTPAQIVLGLMDSPTWSQQTFKTFKTQGNTVYERSIAESHMTGRGSLYSRMAGRERPCVVSASNQNGNFMIFQMATFNNAPRHTLPEVFQHFIIPVSPHSGAYDGETMMHTEVEDDRQGWVIARSYKIRAERTCRRHMLTCMKKDSMKALELARITKAQSWVERMSNLDTKEKLLAEYTAWRETNPGPTTKTNPVSSSGWISDVTYIHAQPRGRPTFLNGVNAAYMLCSSECDISPRFAPESFHVYSQYIALPTVCSGVSFARQLLEQSKLNRQIGGRQHGIKYGFASAECQPRAATGPYLPKAPLPVT
ncbi:hypothetical protein FA95DRAFT_1592272 [Auriscalpium vulgare]|uniref:Uncharacterized protein n=1 Tax=Auriscalpium vulgare TaxID=40419 RepID=A0ACB8SAI1_9AGAM|nr:hypothetical protein FA95DRAFT_1592272 [Auriscalpium vulgare]